MKTPENDKWLDDALSEAIGAEKSRTGFEEWKQKHPEAIEMLTSRTDKGASASPGPLSIRKIIMKSPITKLAVAAVVIIACLIGLSLWRTTGSGIVLADVLARIEQVKAYRYKTSLQWPNFEGHSTSLKSQEYGWRTNWEITDPNSGETTFSELYIFPDKKTLIAIDHKQKKYWRQEWDDRWWGGRNDDEPRTLTKRLLKYKYESLGRSTIDGIEVEGFCTTDPDYAWAGPPGEIQADQRIWVDVKTRLPVRYDFTHVLLRQMGNKKQYDHYYCVMDDFQWDVPFDAAEFEPVIPDDYTGTVIKYPAHITEETAIQGLKILIELLGKYPENITDVDDTVVRLAEESETPAAMRLKEEIKGLTDEEIGNKLVDFLMPIRGLALFYMRLQSDGKDPAYYGKTVTPKDGDKVLVRWKVSDNEYRVIFGDLRAKTVTAEQLTELEKGLKQ